jgi:hypothetical protein
MSKPNPIREIVYRLDMSGKYAITAAEIAPKRIKVFGHWHGKAMATWGFATDELKEAAKALNAAQEKLDAAHRKFCTALQQDNGTAATKVDAPEFKTAGDVAGGVLKDTFKSKRGTTTMKTKALIILFAALALPALAQQPRAEIAQKELGFANDIPSGRHIIVPASEVEYGNSLFLDPKQPGYMGKECNTLYPVIPADVRRFRCGELVRITSNPAAPILVVTDYHWDGEAWIYSVAVRQ